MRRSIRRTLLSWYALILIAMIGTFGGLLYVHRHRTSYDGVDAELTAHGLALAACAEWEPEEGYDMEEAGIYVNRFETDGPTTGYAGVWDEEGRALVRSSGAPERVEISPPGIRDIGDSREIVLAGPKGSTVRIGLGTAEVRRDLAGFLRMVLAVGGATLLLSLAGGWFLVGRVVRPIRRMTDAAERISETNRSERIDVGRTESELGRLARTLNGAFDRLEGALDRQTRFTADASHELRTPLSIVVSNAEGALRRDRTPAEYREALDRCLRAGRRMTSLVEGLLSLARSDAAESALERVDVDLAALLRESVEFLAALAGDHGVSVALQTEDVRIRGDRDRIRDAVGNLISNAIRYNRDGGRVDISLSRSNGQAVLAVTDTGIGIAADEVDRVFERFYRVDVARSREVGGSGLGLAIARWIVEAHGGAVSIESEVGVGTTATVRLPIDV